MKIGKGLADIMLEGAEIFKCTKYDSNTLEQTIIDNAFLKEIESAADIEFVEGLKEKNRATFLNKSIGINKVINEEKQIEKLKLRKIRHI